MDLKSVIDTRRRGEPDMFLFLLVLILAGTGIAMSFSASAVIAEGARGDSLFYLKRQLLWFSLGFMLLLLFQELDYRFYRRFTKVLLLGSIFMLVLVFIPGIGHGAKGSMRWIGFGGLSIQPSEFVKLAVVIYLVKVFSAEPGESYVAQLLIPLVVVGLIFVLIMIQPDFGTAMDLLIISVIIMFVSGFPLLYIIFLFILSIPMFYLLIYQVDYRRQRLLAYLNPWEDRFGRGYHIIQSFIAFKKGGLLGVGLGNSTQKIARLPEPHTDFIFAVMAEETGLFGTLFVILLFILFFWRGVVIANGSSDPFGRLLAMGLTLLVVVQAFINIAVVTGSLPTTGIPLPFISYGGSSMLVTMMASGILLNISRYREVAHDGLHLSDEVLR